MLLSLVSCSQLIFQSFCAPSLSPGPPASGPVECSRLPLCLMYYSVVGIIFTCDNIRYSVYITHIFYCTIIVQCPRTCATPSRFLPFTFLLASGKNNWQLYSAHCFCVCLHFPYSHKHGKALPQDIFFLFITAA